MNMKDTTVDDHSTQFTTIINTADITIDMINTTANTSVSSTNCTVSDIVTAIIGTISVVDNVFVVFIILSYKPLRIQLNSLHILNQSFIDICSSTLLLAGIPLCNENRDLVGVSGTLYCLLWETKVFYWSTVLASTYNLVGLTIDRYLAVVHVMWHKHFMSEQKVLVCLVLCWLFGMVFYVPFGVLTSSHIDTYCQIWHIFHNTTVATLAGVVNFLVTLPIPIIILVYCYIRMAFTIQDENKILPQVSDNDKHRHAKMNKVVKNIFKTMVAMGICFILCWIWNSTWFLLYTLGCDLNRDNGFYHFTVYAANSNCLVNPLIYIFLNTQFQDAVKKVIFKK